MEILCNREFLFTNFHGFCMRVVPISGFTRIEFWKRGSYK